MLDVRLPGEMHDSKLRPSFHPSRSFLSNDTRVLQLAISCRRVPTDAISSDLNFRVGWTLMMDDEFGQTVPETRVLTILSLQVLAVDLLNPTPAAEAKKHKLKTLVPAPRSFFMDVKCPGCFTITTVFSHAQTVVICQGCTTVLCQPTGGKARLTEGCSFRRK
ncbi:ribosomal protein S27-domain-containing protein [Xylaria sp. FL0933]|nr:ribosomal protein S27-domain-containing protein [Xylaria sp. FL0933]